MIRSFQHRGLKRLYERGDRSLIRSDLHDRVEVMLAQLDVASSPEAMRLPRYRLHALSDASSPLSAARPQRQIERVLVGDGEGKLAHHLPL
ncbi:MAG: type II toxin-antitoxin system RelE/ParE family toxin [Desulfurellaceae bacterium]|nr:type II toxin-antitoxin system RelE/ParE family toxin [Desulfurellaceae bacterium]